MGEGRGGAWPEHREIRVHAQRGFLDKGAREESKMARPLAPAGEVLRDVTGFIKKGDADSATVDILKHVSFAKESGKPSSGC